MGSATSTTISTTPATISATSQQYQQLSGELTRDADKISNTSDMYLAQLKLDTKLRKESFLQGDYEKYNQAFTDERVKKLPTELSKNPFFHSSTEQSKALVENVLPPQSETRFEDSKQKQTSSSGISYSEKLKQKRSIKKPTSSQLSRPLFDTNIGAGQPKESE